MTKHFLSGTASAKRGTVKFFRPERGFGFITEEDGADLFFHVRNCDGREPLLGERVQYILAEYRGRHEARDVKVLSE